MADQSTPDAPSSEQNGQNNSTQPARAHQHQPSSYPSPSYPSPSMQPTYSYPPPGQPADGYRASPNAPNMSLPSINLPPIRNMDGHPQPQPQPQLGQPPVGSPLPPPVAPMGAYYPPPGQPLQHGHQMAITSQPLSMPPNMAMRYQLPPQVQDSRIMSGGRHKKEIKRRTKTGCLTCRKRRIKCDEAHPTCRNCQKSKRECLGYDPIFKQQPGPSQLQPAPNSVPPSVPAASTTTSASVPIAYSHVPQGYAPAAGATYAPATGASISPPAVATDPAYEQFPAIDPALAGAAEPAATMHPMPPIAFDPSIRGNVKSEHGVHTSSSALSESQPLKNTRIRMDQLFISGGQGPPPVPPSNGPIPESVVDEIRVLYMRDYARALDSCIETPWYQLKGVHKLLNDRSTMDLFAFFLTQARLPQDYENTRRTVSLEAQLVWRLLCLCRVPDSGAANGTNGAAGTESIDLLEKEAQLRVDVLESLLTYQVLPYNPLDQLRYENYAPQQHKAYEIEFWRHLGHFVSIRDNSPETSKDIENTLGLCRNILSMIESRDVIYSMMVARHYGARFPDLPENMTQAFSTEQEDDRSKMFVAKKFLEDESQGRGMSQVIFRLAGMAIHSWSLGH